MFIPRAFPFATTPIPPLHSRYSYISSLLSPAHWLMANPFQFPSFSNRSSRQADNMFNATNFDVSNLPGYGANEWATPSQNGDWVANQHPTRTQPMNHGRSTSDNSQMTSLCMPEHSNVYGRRSSVPTIHFTPQLTSASGRNMQPQMLQAHSQTQDNRYQQHMTHSINPSPLVPRSLTPLTISGGHIPGPHSASPPRASWCTSQSSSHSHQRPGPGFQSGTSFPPHFNQMTLTVLDTGCGGGRASANRTQRLDARTYPYQQRSAQQPSSWDNRQGAGSPDDLSPIALGSQFVPESSDSATSPGADSDPYRSYPNTPGYTNGAMSDEFETAQGGPRKVKQKLKKRGERESLSGQFERVRLLLQLDKATKAVILGKVIKILGGNVPAPRKEPTQTLQGRESIRSERAKQVSASRSDQTRLFDEIASLMRYNPNQAPRRELLLKEVADMLEQQQQRQMMRGM